MRVKDAMTFGLIGVPETATLSEALDALLRGRIGALFVFDASGEPGYLVPPADTPGFDGARRGCRASPGPFGTHGSKPGRLHTPLPPPVGCRGRAKWR